MTTQELRILVIEDNPNWVTKTVQILRLLGYRNIKTAELPRTAWGCRLDIPVEQRMVLSKGKSNPLLLAIYGVDLRIWFMLQYPLLAKGKVNPVLLT